MGGYWGECSDEIRLSECMRMSLDSLSSLSRLSSDCGGMPEVNTSAIIRLCSNVVSFINASACNC